MKGQIVAVCGLFVAIVVSSFLTPAYAQKVLSKACSAELNATDAKIVLVIQQDGNVEDFAPYGTKLAPVKFPLKVTEITRPTSAITITTYLASPAKTFVCFWKMGSYVCY